MASVQAITQTLQTELSWQQCHDLVKKCTFDQAKELDFEQFLRVVRESQRVYGSRGISMKKNAGAGLTPRKRAQYEHTFAKFDADGLAPPLSPTYLPPMAEGTAFRPVSD